MDFDIALKVAVFAHFATTGRAPSAQEMAATLGATPDDVRQAYARLRANRVLFLEPDGETIRMAPPFSGVPTQHRVTIGERVYYANCAWDALGIVAALHEPSVVHSECAQSHEPLALDVGIDGPAQSAWLFHSLVPAARWWHDLVFT